jgi:hypothetical protein
MEVAAVNSLFVSVLIGICFACALFGVVGGTVGAHMYRRSNRIWISGLVAGVTALVLSALATWSLMYSWAYFAEKNVHANQALAATLPPPQMPRRSIAAFDMNEKSVSALKAIGVGDPEIGLCLKIGCDVTFFRHEPVFPSPQTN